MITEQKVLEALGNVDDPDLKRDIVSLGMVKDLKIEGNKVSFSVELTTPACPMKEMIKNACLNAVKHFVSKDAEVAINMTARVRSVQTTGKQKIEGVEHIIAIASGKGGVGKSTVASNLAVSLARQGAAVGIIDADIYGPSIPMMFDVLNEKPGQVVLDGKNKMIPVEAYGVKILSIGFFASPSQAIIWRGPMASKALMQLFQDAHWGKLDYLIVDLPPGTGDIHMSLAGQVPLTGVVMVTTPQQVALSDARKGAAMFRHEHIKVPVLGVIENMSWFEPVEFPGHRYHLFGNGGGLQLAEELKVPLLGQIPLVQGICESGDAGRPVVFQEGSMLSDIFTLAAGKIAQALAIRTSASEFTRVAE